VEVQHHIFLTLALDGDEMSASCPSHITNREGIELDGIWVLALPGPMHLGLKTGPLFPHVLY